jgi:hypothetical protein
MDSKSKLKYDKDNTIFIGLKLNKKTDADIIENIDLNNKQGSLKNLIRDGIKKART